MVQTAEAEAFLARVAALPKGQAAAGVVVDLDEVLQPSLDDEMALRRLLATDRSNARLSNPHVGLVDVFDAPADIRITRARVVKDDQDWNAQYVMPLPEDERRKEGEPCIVADLDEFKRNWGVFTEGSLSQLVDWNNVIAAGGSVLACLAPLADEDKASKRAIRKHYHSAAYPTSDVDLFLWGLTPEQAEKKVVQIYEAVRDSVPWDVTCVRSKNTISIHSQYPYRSVQIVLRLYHSPAEVLAGFDIDAPCCAYDGTRVWASPRAIVAMMRQCNTTDVTRRSPSYEIRLSKYARRGFEVYVPSLVRTDIDPTIFERSIVRVEGLARLLVLERLATFDERQVFLRSRRELRGRPDGPWRYRRSKRKYKNDLKALSEVQELEMNNYDVTSLHIPYGPGWDARRIDKLIYQTDLAMNSTFNPKNKGRRLHRHPAFFGTIDECIEDCCENCPEPIDDAERELQTKEEEVYIRGHVTFMQDNPGRQVITGSFNPIDVGEWSAQVYIGQMERFFAAIAIHDRAAVADMIKEGVDVNRRDHVGRSPLHFAIMCHATEIACDLVDAGARMTARLVDGRTSLHLAAQHDQVTVVRKLLERNAQNKDAVDAGTNEVEESEESKEKEPERMRLSSEDDWSSGDDGVMDVDDDEGQADDEDEDKGNKSEEDDKNDEKSSDEDEDDKKKSKKKEDEPAPVGDEIPDDNTEEPDVFDLDAADWDFGLTPLVYAVIFAALPILEDLISAGVKVKESTQNNKLNMHPLTFTLLRPDEDEACKVAERLILAGATSSPADAFQTIFYTIVASKKVKLASTIMKCDPNLNAVLNFPCVQWNSVLFPIVLAINERQYAMMAALLAYGAKLDLAEEDVTKAIATRSNKDTRRRWGHGNHNYFPQTYMPVETAVVNHDDVVQLLINLGANVNLGLRSNEANYCAEENKSSVFDWVNKAIESMEKQMEDRKREGEEKKVDIKEAVDFSKVTSWKEYAMLAGEISSYTNRVPTSETEEERLAEIENMESVKRYFVDVRELLVSIGAKTWAELQPSEKPKSTPRMKLARLSHHDDLQDGKRGKTFEDCDFVAMSSRYYNRDIPRHLVKHYHVLHEACIIGDHARIQMMCLPPFGAPVDGLPLQITAQLRDPSGRYATGVTPFSIAVERRQWDTARLILAIAAAQYEVEESEAEFSVGDMDLDGDGSDDGSDVRSNYTGNSDDTVGQKENHYVDVANRPSAVKCDAKPGQFFTIRRPYGYIHEGRYLEETVFDKAIREDDLEAFVKLLNMVANLPIPEDVTGSVTKQILAYDRHDMLDELIRNTGVGVDLKTVRHEAKDAIPTNDENRLYLGLNVHGKKRADLARRNDPNAGYETQEHPLLWKALVLGSEKIVDYLGTDKPFAAYRSYAMSHSDERAERLRSIEKLKELLPQWLGFRTNSLGESPLTVAVLSGKLDMLQVLFAKHKIMMKSALHDKHKSTNSNILHIAVRSNKVVDTAVLDFLLARNVSPLETDTAGCNIYHILCQRNDCRLLGHLLEKLPRETNEAMFKQQIREYLNTPLHAAVEANAIKAVELLLARSNVANTIRDCEGCFPLHVAIRRGCPGITKLLIDASPSTLFTENGVGSTALESAALIQFRKRMSSFTDGEGFTPRITGADSYVNTGPARFDLAHLEKEVPLLRETIDSLLKLGKLRKNTKLEKELLGFADKMEEHVRKLRQAQAVVVKKPEKTKGDENPLECADRFATYEVVREALKHVKGERELVHLIDVQKSVDNNMPRATARKKADDDDDMHVEEKEVETSFVQEHVGRTSTW